MSRVIGSRGPGHRPVFLLVAPVVVVGVDVVAGDEVVFGFGHDGDQRATCPAKLDQLFASVKVCVRNVKEALRTNRKQFQRRSPDGLPLKSWRPFYAAAGWSAASLSYWIGDINAAELCLRRVL